MELKIIYGNGKDLKIEAVVSNQEERRDAIKMIKMTIADLSEKEIKESKKYYTEETVEKVVELASEGQKAYMDKLGIVYDEQTTKHEAIDLINAWKLEHGVPITGKNSK